MNEWYIHNIFTYLLIRNRISDDLVFFKFVFCLILFLKGPNYMTQMLLRAINISGKLHMVPAILGEDYIIRFAVCSARACDADMLHAWQVSM